MRNTLFLSFILALTLTALPIMAASESFQFSGNVNGKIINTWCDGSEYLYNYAFDLSCERVINDESSPLVTKILTLQDYFNSAAQDAVMFSCNGTVKGKTTIVNPGKSKGCEITGGKEFSENVLAPAVRQTFPDGKERPTIQLQPVGQTFIPITVKLYRLDDQGNRGELFSTDNSYENAVDIYPTSINGQEMSGTIYPSPNDEATWKGTIRETAATKETPTATPTKIESTIKKTQTTEKYTGYIGEKVGKVSGLKGNIEVFENGKWKKISSDTPIKFGDKIRTGSDGRLQITLADETIFTVGPNGEFVIDEFVYDPSDPTLSKTIIGIQKGVFRYVTGKIAKKAPSRTNITTPGGYTGIRGTDFIIGYNDKTTTVEVNEGVVTFTPSTDNAETTEIIAGKIFSYKDKAETAELSDLTPERWKSLVDGITPISSQSLEWIGKAIPIAIGFAIGLAVLFWIQKRKKKKSK